MAEMKEVLTKEREGHLEEERRKAIHTREEHRSNISPDRQSLLVSAAG